MNDDNFLRYLKALGFTPDTTRNEEGIDVVISLDIASDKRTVEKNNNVSNSTGNLFKQIPRNKTPGSANAGRKKEEQGRLRTSIKSDPKKLTGKNVKKKLQTKGTIKKNKKSITSSSDALHEKSNKESHGIHALTSSSTPHINKIYNSSNTNVLSFPTTSANSSYNPSLSKTPPQTPINISNKYLISCYMDSVIQCLYWTPGFTEMLLSARHRPLKENKNISEYWDSRYTLQIFKEDYSRKSGQELLLLPEGYLRILIAQDFRNVIQCYFNNEINLVEEYTRKLIYHLNIYFLKKTGKQGQQDSQDFLSNLLDILTNMYYERLKVTKSEVEVNTAPVPDTAQEAIKENESTQIHSFIQDLFQSTVIKTTTCVYCKKQSFRAEFQESFLLEFGEIPPASVSFQELFNRSCYVYVGKDCLNTTECIKKSKTLHHFYYGKGRDKPNIQHNDGYLLHTQQMTILEPAKNLIIFFKRFERTADGRISRKINTIVTDISDRINLKDYMYSNPEEKDIMYGLYAFIYHRGALDGGHYINYVKIKDQWWFVDDMKKASPVDSYFDTLCFNQHLAESYILFYTKIK